MLAETFAVLTTLPSSPRITPGQARSLVRHNVTERMVRAAEKVGASRIVTFNRRDFERFSSATEVEIVVV